MSLGKNLAAYRRARGLTQQQLGDLLSVSAQAVSKWENDQTEPDLQTLRRLSILYGVKADDLLREEQSAEAAAAGQAFENSVAADTEAAGAAKDHGAAVKERGASESETGKSPAAGSTAKNGDSAAEPTLIGYCADCHCPVYRGNEVRHPTAGLLCKLCYGKRVKAAKANYARGGRTSKGLKAPSIYTANAPDDAPSFGWAFLSFLIPIAGLVLFLVWRGEYPLRARSCFRGFIADIVLYVILVVLLVCLTSCVACSVPRYYYY